MTSVGALMAGVVLAAAAPGVVTGQSTAEGPKREMIDVGRHRLQMLRGGKGGPTVVFEAGIGSGLPAFLRVAVSVNEFTSTVCYSRAGIGPSEPAAFARTPVAVATELHVLLARAGIPPPYVLVGHSIGGWYMRAFASRYAQETCGLVLIDPTPERINFDDMHDPAEKAKLEAEVSGMKGAAGLEGPEYLKIQAAGKFEGGEHLPPVPTVIITALRPGPPKGSEKEKTFNATVTPKELEKAKAEKARIRALHDELFRQDK